MLLIGVDQSTTTSMSAQATMNSLCSRVYLTSGRTDMSLLFGSTGRRSRGRLTQGTADTPPRRREPRFTPFLPFNDPA
jgi:hypothetical protein